MDNIYFGKSVPMSRMYYIIIAIYDDFQVDYTNAFNQITVNAMSISFHFIPFRSMARILKLSIYSVLSLCLLVSCLNIYTQFTRKKRSIM